MATKIVEGFSISHAQVLDGATLGDQAVAHADQYDIYGVREGNLEVDADSFENTGDDFVLSTWDWINFATIAITSGYISFEVLATLSGETVTTSGAAPADYHSIPLWTEDQVNSSARPVLLRIPSRDSAGVARTLDVVLYKAFFAPIAFEGPAYKDGLGVSYTARAVLSDTDEIGVALAKRAVGRLISKPAA